MRRPRRPLWARKRCQAGLPEATASDGLWGQCTHPRRHAGPHIIDRGGDRVVLWTNRTSDYVAAVHRTDGTVVPISSAVVLYPGLRLMVRIRTVAG